MIASDASDVRLAAYSALPERFLFNDPAAQPLHVWTAQQKKHVLEKFARMHEAWCGDWIPCRDVSAPRDEIRIVERGKPTASLSDEEVGWSFMPEPGNATRRLALDSLVAAAPASLEAGIRTAAIGAIARAMFVIDLAEKGPAQPVIAIDVARKALDSWLQRMSDLLGGIAVRACCADGTGASTTGATDPWSGDLCLAWGGFGGSWEVRLPHTAVLALLGGEEMALRKSDARPDPGAAKHALDEALADHPVSLQVLLEGATLTLGQLQELRVGDVVPLKHLIGSPALVVTADGRPVCDGWLGQHGGAMAVELSRTPAPR